MNNSLDKNKLNCECMNDLFHHDAESRLRFCFSGQISEKCKNEKCKHQKLKIYSIHETIASIDILLIIASFVSTAFFNPVISISLTTIFIIFLIQWGGSGQIGSYRDILANAYLSDNPKSFIRKEIIKRAIKFVVYSTIGVSIILLIDYLIKCISFYNKWH